LVVLDTLAHFWDVDDENDNAKVLRAMKPLLQFARDSEAALLLIHHDRKTGGQGGRSIRGGRAGLGGGDQALLLEEADKDRRILRSVGRYPETPRKLVIELRGNEHHRVEEADKLTEDAVRLWHALPLAPAPGKDQERLAGETGIHGKRVR